VDEPGNFVEGGDLEDLEAAGLVGDPVGAGWARGDRQECLSYFGLTCFRESHSSTSIIGAGRGAECGRRFDCRDGRGHCGGGTDSGGD